MKKLLTFILVLGSLVGSAQNTIWNFPAYSGSMTGVRFAVGVGANSTRYVLWDNLGFSLSGHTHTFASLTSIPTTLSGHGITDAYTKAQVDAAFAPLSHTHGMADLTGFNIVSPINGSVLKYNSGTGKWEVGTDNGGTPAWGSITGALSSQTDLNTALGLKAPLASPTFTGAPAAPTATTGTSTTQLATTAFVQQELTANTLFFSNTDFSGAGTVGSPIAILKDATPTNGSANLITSGAAFTALAAKQATLVSATNIKTVNGTSLLGSGDLTISGTSVWGGITGTLSSQTDLQTALNAKQATLVSATNIKTINGTSLLGSGDIVVIGSASYPTQQNHTSGATVTISDQTTNIWMAVNPASTISALTITFPATPVDGQRIDISFGGTLTSGAVVTTLTLAGNGKSILQASTPVAPQAGENISYMYKSSNTTWYRIN